MSRLIAKSIAGCRRAAMRPLAARFGAASFGAAHWASCVLAVVLCVNLGCSQLLYRFDHRPVQEFVPNPIELPAVNDAFVWQQVIDTVDDYFRISREQPVQNSAEMILEGRVETAYQIGASVLEPWRKDTLSGFERMESSLQSIRRKATVIVRPTGAGYTVEVVVLKDIEDTDRTHYATESTASRRHDGTVLRRDNGFDDSPQTLGWISLGRDSALEQKILRDIFSRVTKRDGRKK